MNYRPLYHFLPPKGWMNDPNGPIWYEGYYHLFYQYNPYGDTWGSIHWGHARSRDLVRWEHLPVALAPSTTAGELHCFSGCAVLQGDTPTLLYTSVGAEDRGARIGAEQWLATSGDGMLTWQKHPAPVLTQEIHGSERIRDWRDPFVWQEDGLWKMLLGGEREGYGVITAYSSQDLQNWRYDGILYEDKRHHFLECPNLLRFGDRHVLIYSPDSAVRYQVGKVADGCFLADSEGILDHSACWGFYAPNTLLNDPKRRYLTWGWLREDARGSLSIPGWQGVQSLPRVLCLDDSGALVQSPAEELLQLRCGDPEQIVRERFCGEHIAHTRGNALELQVDADLSPGDELLLHLLESPDGRERTTVRFSVATATLSLEKGKSSLHDGTGRQFQFAAVPEFDGRLSLRVFLDVSVIEVFAGKGTTMSGRVYPALEDSQSVRLEGSAKALHCTIWNLKQ